MLFATGIELLLKPGANFTYELFWFAVDIRWGFNIEFFNTEYILPPVWNTIVSDVLVKQKRVS